jgi:hypothetical protein
VGRCQGGAGAEATITDATTEDSIRIEWDRSGGAHRPGEALTGHVVVDPVDGASCRSIRLLRFWRTHGRGNEDTGGLSSVEIHEGPLLGPGPHRIPFSLETPDGPLSYRGALLAVDHYLEARLERSAGVAAVDTRKYVLEPGATALTPDPHLITVTGSRARRGTGCRIGLGAFCLLFGLVTLPLGIVGIVLGAVLLFPVVRRGLAGSKLGEVTSRLDHPLVQPGEAVRVEVRMDPLKRRTINGVSATIRGREVCVSGHDRDREVRTHEVHSRVVALSGPRSVAAGEATVLSAEIPVPDSQAWTFSSDHNEVTWDLTIHVDIPSWPDWYEEHKLVLWPWPLLSADDPEDEPVEDEPGRAVVERELVGLLETLGHTGSPAPPPAESSDDEPTSELATSVRAALEAGSLGGDRSRLIREMKGRSFIFGLEVDHFRSTFGSGPDAGYRRGRTVTGTVYGTDVQVVVRFPESQNAEIDALAPGSIRKVRGSVVDWEKLSGRPVLHASLGGK